MKKIFCFCILIFSLSDSYAQIARGADVSWLSEMEQLGRKWKDSLGVQRDLLDILDDYCINAIRLRVWVNPANGYSAKQDVINLAKRASAKGYRLLIDFHYSDSWVDPGQQTKPATWANYNITQLRQAVYDHTYDVLNALKGQGITPEWVQVGNETNNGMLWPDGQASTNMANYASFVSKGYDAVKAVFPKAKVIVHVSNGFDNALFRWNIGGLISNGAKFDVIGMSMYPDVPADWQTYAAQTFTNMQDMVKTYNKEIMVSEIGLATASETEGKSLVEKVIQNLQSLSNNKGLGVFWWEPQAYNWKGYEKVAWNTSTQQATLAMKGFKYGCINVIPKDCNNTNNGTAFLDNCDRCVGGNTGRAECTKVGEAETDACSFDGVLEDKNVNFKGGSYINVPNAIGAEITFYVNAATAGSKILSFRYASGGTSDRAAVVNINGSNVTSSFSFPATGAFTTYKTVDLTLTLKAGVNIIKLSSATIDGLANIDQIGYVSAGLSKGDCEEVITNITNGNEAQLFELYPNPSQSSFHFKTSGSLDIEITDAEGKTLNTYNNISELEFGTDLQPGVYFAKVQNKVYKFVKY